jgi:hypothetical protein
MQDVGLLPGISRKRFDKCRKQIEKRAPTQIYNIIFVLLNESSMFNQRVQPRIAEKPSVIIYFSAISHLGNNNVI